VLALFFFPRHLSSEACVLLTLALVLVVVSCDHGHVNTQRIIKVAREALSQPSKSYVGRESAKSKTGVVAIA
jgi:hypothetical protein